MFFHRIPAAIIAMVVAASSVGFAQAETPIDGTFTYQGRLVQGGVAVNASADFIFRIYDSEIAGNQIDVKSRWNRHRLDRLFRKQALVAWQAVSQRPCRVFACNWLRA